MIQKSNIKNLYLGFSFVEVLITLLIISLVLIVTSLTLAALIKASAISSAKTLTRSESEFILEIVEKTIKNSQSEEIYMYASSGVLTPAGTINNGGVPPQVIELNSGDGANEVHFRPVRSSQWICLGFFEDDEGIGYVVRGSSTTQTANCLLTGQIVILNSDEVDIEQFSIKGYETSGGNYAFVVDLIMKPVYWIPGPESQFKPEYVRQLLVTTEKLTY